MSLLFIYYAAYGKSSIILWLVNLEAFPDASNRSEWLRVKGFKKITLGPRLTTDLGVKRNYTFADISW